MNYSSVSIRILCLSLIGFLTSVSHATVETYTIDPAHSSVGFGIRHFFTKVTGHFKNFEGTLKIDREALDKSEIKASIDTTSVDTSQPNRDKHLQTPEFFDTAKYPKMTFESKSWKKMTSDSYEVTGDLSLHGITKPVVLTVKSLGFGEGMKGSQISGWEAKTVIKRSDFGITTGAPAVGDDVEIEINVEAKRQ
jgi:polyisoprenoid-binding protein YceI